MQREYWTMLVRYVSVPVGLRSRSFFSPMYDNRFALVLKTNPRNRGRRRLSVADVGFVQIGLCCLARIRGSRSHRMLTHERWQTYSCALCKLITFRYFVMCLLLAAAI